MEWGTKTQMEILCTKTMPALKEKSVVCLGYFDGVHQGHMALLHAAKEIAHEKGLTMCVHTFDRSPFEALHPNKHIFKITTEKEKESVIEQAGCQKLLISPFDDAMRNMSGKDFFYEILLKKLCCQALVTGYDHVFGHKGDTNVTALSLLCEQNGVLLHVVPKVTLPSGEVISSTAIRKAFQLGQMDLVQQMLGRKVDHDMIMRYNMWQTGEVEK